MAQPIVTKFGVCLETKWRRIMHRSWVGYICTCARADVPFPYLVNGWTDCDEIWYVVRDPPARRFTEVDDGVQLYVRTCAPLFDMSGTARRIALKFGVKTH